MRRRDWIHPHLCALPALCERKPPMLPFLGANRMHLWGGPSHIDTYDMKPDAPVEYRGEFKPIRTNVPGFDICELLPLQAQIADKLAIIRNLKFNPNFHDPAELFSG